MIDFATESCFSLSDAPSRLDVHRRGGRPIHRATVFRWAKHGIRGVRLETLRVGGSLVTSMEAMQRFFDRLSAGGDQDPPPTPPPPRQRQKALARVDRELDALGV